MDRGIKIRLRYNRIEALCEILKTECIAFVPEDAHEQLLKEILHDLHERVYIMALKSNQDRFTLNFSAGEALGFWQYFGKTNIAYNPYGDVIIRDMIQSIHKTYETHKRLIYVR